MRRGAPPRILCPSLHVNQAFEGKAGRLEIMMLRRLLIVGIAAGMLSACADYGDYADTGYYGDTAYYGPYGDIAYDGWYDGYYGPIYDGYWDGPIFYFRTGDADDFQAGSASHFRHTAAPGFTPMHGMTHARTAPPPPRH